MIDISGIDTFQVCITNTPINRLSTEARRKYDNGIRLQRFRCHACLTKATIGVGFKKPSIRIKINDFQAQ
jgi:transposase-like protein